MEFSSYKYVSFTKCVSMFNVLVYCGYMLQQSWKLPFDKRHYYLHSFEVSISDGEMQMSVSVEKYGFVEAKEQIMQHKYTDH